MTRKRRGRLRPTGLLGKRQPRVHARGPVLVVGQLVAALERRLRHTEHRTKSEVKTAGHTQRKRPSLSAARALPPQHGMQALTHPGPADAGRLPVALHVRLLCPRQQLLLRGARPHGALTHVLPLLHRRARLLVGDAQGKEGAAEAEQDSKQRQAGLPGHETRVGRRSHTVCTSTVSALQQSVHHSRRADLCGAATVAARTVHAPRLL